MSSEIIGNIEIHYLGTESLGRCYHAISYRLESSVPIQDSEIKALKAANKLGYGQEFFYSKMSFNEVTNKYEVFCQHKVDSSD